MPGNKQIGHHEAAERKNRTNRQIDPRRDDDEGQPDTEDGVDCRLLHHVEEVVGAEEVGGGDSEEDDQARQHEERL